MRAWQRFASRPRKRQLQKHARARRNVPRANRDAVFLNIPYDAEFSRLYLAYIAGLIHLGLDPRVTLGIPGGERRLDRIFDLIQECRYSIHDLSRIELDRVRPPTPRFNMPFELGLAVCWSKLHTSRHTWFVFESEHRRLQKSLSDLDGSDPNIHHGKVEGVMRELCNCFVRSREMPSIASMLVTYRKVSGRADRLLRRPGTANLFEPCVFEDLCFAARFAVGQS